MARLGMVPRILGLFVLILALLVGGVFWFDYLGLVDAQSIIAPVTALFGQKNPNQINAEDPVLLDSIRIRKQEEALALQVQDLNTKQDDVSKQNQDIAQKEADLSEREKAQDDREKSFIEKQKAYDNRHNNLVQNSQYLTSMKPDDAVKILNGYDDQLLIDTLRTTQEIADAAGNLSLVSVWLSKMDPARAAEIQRKMTLKPPTQ